MVTRETFLLLPWCSCIVTFYNVTVSTIKALGWKRGKFFWRRCGSGTASGHLQVFLSMTPWPCSRPFLASPGWGWALSPQLTSLLLPLLGRGVIWKSFHPEHILEETSSSSPRAHRTHHTARLSAQLHRGFRCPFWGSLASLLKGQVCLPDVLLSLTDSQPL